MPRDGKCPRCLYKATLISFMEAAGDGKLIPLFKELPSEVQVYFLSYLSLFRPKSGSAIQLTKVERLTTDLVDLIKLRYVHVQGQVDRPSSPRIWAQAMEQMIEQAPRLTLPIKNHNYLKSIVWDVADKADHGQEKKTIVHKQNIQTRPIPRDDASNSNIFGAYAAYDAKNAGNGEIKDALKDVSGIVGGME